MTTLRTLEIDDPSWQAFVDTSPKATAFHQPSWTTLLADCYGFRPFALAVLDEHESISAGLPFVEINSRVRRKRAWVSLPFTDALSPLVARPRMEAALLEGLEEASLSRIERVEVRDLVQLDGSHQINAGVRNRLVLEPDEQAVFRRLDRSQVQRNLKRSVREGVVVHRAETIGELDQVFYRLQVQTRRRLGVPVQPRRFYTLLWRHMIEPGHGFVLLAYSGDTPIAGGIFLTSRETAIYKYGASDHSFWRLRPNIPVFWRAIQIACAQRATVFDFGRTEHDHEGLRTFKRNWAPEEPLVYTTLGPQPREAPRKVALSLTAGVIKHTPSWVCRAVGAGLYRYAS